MLTLEGRTNHASDRMMQTVTPPDIAELLPKLTVTDAAETAMVDVARARGPQAVLASWPGGAAYLPAEQYTPSPYDTVIGHVGGCPIYADERQLACYADRHATLDIAYPSSSTRRPILLIRNATPQAGRD